LAAAGIAAILLGNVSTCASAQPGTAQQKVFEAFFSSIDKGFTSGIRERKFVVIKTAKEWRDTWQAHSSISVPPQPLPSVDFDREMIVAVFSGEKRTGGYGIEITKIEEESAKRQLLIFVRETQPPPGSMTIQAVTQPYQIVRMKKLDFAVEFVFNP
jgi:PrcB C-terminal